LNSDQLSASSVSQVTLPDNFAQALMIPLPTLRSLWIEWNINDDAVSDEFPGFINALQVLASCPNCINELSLTLLTPWSHTLANQDWEKIDHVLADRSTFRRLEKLSIKFWSHLHIDDESGEKRMQDCLTEFRVTKLLRLSLASSDYLDFQFNTR